MTNTFRFLLQVIVAHLYKYQIFLLCSPYIQHIIRVGALAFVNKNSFMPTTIPTIAPEVMRIDSEGPTQASSGARSWQSETHLVSRWGRVSGSEGREVVSEGIPGKDGSSKEGRCLKFDLSKLNALLNNFIWLFLDLSLSVTWYFLLKNQNESMNFAPPNSRP